MAKTTEPFDRTIPTLTGCQRTALDYLATHKGVDKPRTYGYPSRLSVLVLVQLGLAEPWGTGFFITARGSWLAKILEVDGRTVEGRKRRGRVVASTPRPRRRNPPPAIGGLSLDAAKALLDAWRKS